MPLYEFRCEACGARFEALVDAGTQSHDCRECGAEGAERVMSKPAETFKLVRSGREYRKQDQRNRKLHEATKRDFKQKRQQAREAAKARKGGGSA
jgi:putative FmdB family regulatory protein